MGLHSSGAEHPLLTAREVRNTRRLAHGSESGRTVFPAPAERQSRRYPGCEEREQLRGHSVDRLVGTLRSLGYRRIHGARPPNELDTIPAASMVDAGNEFTVEGEDG